VRVTDPTGELGPEDQRETSLASRLMSAGMQLVVGMGYSVTVSAAKLMMQTLYWNLFAQKEFVEAIRLGRKELFQRKARQAYYNQTVDLEDWVLPVVYCNQTVNFDLRSMSPEEEETFFRQQAKRYRFQPPTYGFVGRDLDILKIEKALLHSNVSNLFKESIAI
jgi:hypothetical protein